MFNDSLIKKRFPNGLSIAYEKGTDTTVLTDKLIEGIFDVNRTEQITNNYDDFIIQESLGNYVNLVKELLVKYDQKTRNDIYKKLNTVNLVDNVREIYRMYEGNIDVKKIGSIFNNNRFLFSNNLKNIPKNYTYIRKKQYIHMEDLDKFYIGNSIDNMESKVKKLILSDSKIPKYIELLSVPSDDYNQYLLGENLRLIVKEKGLIDYNDFDKNKASTLFNHTLFENLNRIDKRSITDDLSFIENSEHKDKFIGIRGLLNTTLNKMNHNFVNNLNELASSEEYIDFLNNFNTIKEWEKYDNAVDRLTDLKDEFITRILFSTLVTTSMKYIDNIFDDRVKEFTKELKKNNITEYNDKELNKKDLVLATGENMDNFFDEKRFKGKNIPTFINSIKNKILVTYPSSKKYIRNLRPLRTNNEDDDVIIEELNADVLNREPSDVVRNRVVKDTYDLLNKLNNTPDKSKKAIMKKLFKVVNYYLIQNDELTIQNYSQQLVEKIEKKDNNKVVDGKNLEIEQVARQMLKNNGNYTFDEKMIYYLYNSNRLAHSIDFIGLFKNREDNFVMNPNIRNERDKKRSLINRYSYLTRFGIDVDFINHSIDTYSDPNNENMTIYNIIDRNTRMDDRNKNIIFLSDGAKESTINYLKNKIDVDNQTIYKEIDEKEIEDIIMSLEKIRNNPNNNHDDYLKNKKLIDSIELTTKERNAIFAIKTSLIHNLIERTEKKAHKKLEDMTRADKKRIYDKDGYIIEYQKDSSDLLLPLLVCYDVKFHNSAFSVHIIDSDIELNAEKLLREQSIKHGKNVTGLIPAKDPETYNIKYDENLSSGFISDYNRINKIEANISNKMKFDYTYSRGDIKEQKYLVKKYEFINKEEKKIYENNTLSLLSNKDIGTKSVGNAALEVLSNSKNNLMCDIVNHKNAVIYEDVQRSLFGEVYNVKLAGKLFNVPKEDLINYIDENSKYYNTFNSNNNTK